MNAEIPNHNIAAFVRIIQTLGKMGEEIYIAVDRGVLKLCFYNPTNMTEYARYEIDAAKFFDSYQIFPHVNKNVKILSKALLAALKNFKSIHRLILWLREGELELGLHCNYSVEKLYTITVEEVTDFQNVEEPGNDSNVIRISTSADSFDKLFKSIGFTTDEITFEYDASTRLFSATSYLENTEKAKNSNISMLKLKDVDFESFGFTLGEPFSCKLTFSYKHFSAFLSYCQQGLQSISMRMGNGAAPIVFDTVAAANQNDVRAILFLATQRAEETSSTAGSSSNDTTTTSGATITTPSHTTATTTTATSISPQGHEGQGRMEEDEVNGHNSSQQRLERVRRRPPPREMDMDTSVPFTSGHQMPLGQSFEREGSEEEAVEASDDEAPYEPLNKKQRV